MSDIMRPMSIGHLMNWALSEYKKKGSIFGIDKLVHYTSGQALPIYEEKIESPFGTAAGPNTQLAQNIIASYERVYLLSGQGSQLQPTYRYLLYKDHLLS